MFRMISVTSSFTPGMVENSCWTPSILTDVTATPGSEESSTRRRLLPKVVPKPLSSGSAINLAVGTVGLAAQRSQFFGSIIFTIYNNPPYSDSPKRPCMYWFAFPMLDVCIRGDYLDVQLDDRDARLHRRSISSRAGSCNDLAFEGHRQPSRSTSGRGSVAVLLDESLELLGSTCTSRIQRLHRRA